MKEERGEDDMGKRKEERGEDDRGNNVYGSR